MVQFNFTERTIKAKVVYYGPAQSGKTTNLEQVHRLTDPAQTNRLVSLNTAKDRTLFFDLLPFSLGTVSGYDFKIQLYTVPGQVQYNATRRVVLAGADAVVFVADSRKSAAKENLQAFDNMKVNLLANRLVPEKVPVIFQFNKQDLPDLQTQAELSRAINPWGRRAFPAVASQGKGVLETFVAIAQEMLVNIATKYNLKEKGLDPANVPDLVNEAFSNLLEKVKASGSEGPPTPLEGIVIAQSIETDRSAPLPPSAEAGQVSEELLHRAIRSNVELAEVLAGLVSDMNQGLAAIASQADLLQIFKDEAREKRANAVNIIQTEAARLREVVSQLGLPAGQAPPPPPRKPAPPPPPPARPSRPPNLKDMLKEVVSDSGFGVNLQIPDGTPLPRCAPSVLTRTVSLLLTGTSALSTPGSAAVLRCETKPVLLKGPNGQVKKEFLMLALTHAVALGSDAQVRISQGSEPGPLGEMGRAVRESGGFIRFAPLAGGQLETRLFLPAD